jgi:Fe-S cluster assembly ATPase SufC
MTFQPSKSLVVMARIGHYRMTRDASLPDFTLWCDGRIMAQGGFKLIDRLFNEKESELSDVRDVVPDCCYCGRGPDLCLCDGSGTA